MSADVARKALHAQGNDQTRATTLEITVEELRAFREAYNAALKLAEPPKNPTPGPPATARNPQGTRQRRSPGALPTCPSCGHVIRDNTLCGCS